jgi:tetratricopeptide (TPR) repeat protein
MAPHAFVAMPFGTKENIDFDSIYEEMIKPALEREAFEVFRADKEIRAGNIRTDMFQELLLADLVVVDLSIDNPNVWYELGIRHALRARGVIHINCKREHMPFDSYTDRVLRYHVKDGKPDPKLKEEDQRALAEMARETMASWPARKISPVYQHLHRLEEPNWRKFRVDQEREFWEAFEKWEDLIRVARKTNRPGDILVLAEESPFYAIQVEAYRRAAKELIRLGHFPFALEQIEKALDIDPEDVETSQQKGIILGRLKKFDKAKGWLERLVETDPNDSETLSLRGRVEKDAWVDCWRKEGKSIGERSAAACADEGYLKESIKFYSEGFKNDPSHYYSGINAVTLIHLHHQLTGDPEQMDLCKKMEGGLRWALESALSKETEKKKDYWARVTLGDLEVLSGDTKAVERAYKDAVAVSDKDWFALESPRQQLLLLKELHFKLEQVEAGLKIFDREIEKIQAPWQPRFVYLFSGHMIDSPGRKEARFPADKEKIAEEAIAKKLDELGAGKEDLALCGGACGGDLLFAEACLNRGLRLEIRIPFDEPNFFKESVTFAGARWREGYYAVKNSPLTKVLLMPDELGPLPKNANAFERNNKWQLYSALAWGFDKVNFICLWNGKGGAGPGGTKHMIEEVQKHSGRVFILDTTTLWS